MAIICKSYHNKHSKNSEVYQLPKMAQNARENSLPNPHFQSFSPPSRDREWVLTPTKLWTSLMGWSSYANFSIPACLGWTGTQTARAASTKMQVQILESFVYEQRPLLEFFVGWPLGHLGKPTLIHHYWKLSDIPEPYITWLYFLCCILLQIEEYKMESHLPRLPSELKSEIKDEILYDIAVFIAIMLVGKLCSSLWKFR